MPLPLTRKQERILEFIRTYQEQHGSSPTLREIAATFAINVTAVVAHVKALKKKGYLAQRTKAARSLRVTSEFDSLRKRVIDIPVLETSPGKLDGEITSCISIDVQTLGVARDAELFAVQVKGNSMKNKNLLPGDLVICDPTRTPKSGDIVAVEMNGRRSLTVFRITGGKRRRAYPKSESSELSSAGSLRIRGVTIAVIRRCG